MTRVVARCPNCGVEHDDARGGPCEVCGTTLRFWCRVHGPETGWLDTPECPACAAELSARRAPPVPPPAPERAPVPSGTPRWRRTRVPTRRPHEPAAPYEGRPTRDVLREGAEDLRPYVATGAGVAWRLVRALFALIRNGIVGAIVGAVIGGAVAYNQRGDLVWPVISGAIIGGGVGVLIGLITAIRVLFAESPRRIR